MAQNNFDKAVEQVKNEYEEFNGEIIDSITIGIGSLQNCCCIFDTNTKKIIHNNLTEREATFLFEEIRKRII